MSVRASKYQLASTFIGANLVSLGSGTPYMYSFYAPQLLKKCHLDIGKSSDFSFAMSIGMSAMGVLAGLIIDISPQFATGLGGLLTFIAYSTLYYCYTHEYGSVFVISMALIMIGFGSVCSFYAAVKCCTANFPNHRGAAGAFPISQYALSGLLFSFFCSHVFGEDMKAVFKFLTIVCSSTAFLGCFTLKIFDHTSSDDSNHQRYSNVSTETTEELSAAKNNRESGDNTEIMHHSKPISVNKDKSTAQGHQYNYRTFRTGSSSSIANSTDASEYSSSATSLKRSDSTLWARDLVGSLQFWGLGRARPSDSALATQNKPSMHRTSFSIGINGAKRKQSFNDTRSNSSLLQSNANAERSAVVPVEGFDEAEEGTLATLAKPQKSLSWRDNNVLKTMTKPRFYTYLLTLATLQGIGQMYIFAVGFVVTTQIHSSPDPSRFNQEELQSLQVSLISIMSFCGRLLSGPLSDLMVKKFHAQRLWIIIMSSALTLFASRQLISPNLLNYDSTTNLNNVSYSSVLFGFAFGMTFGTFPAIIADSFGTEGFSTIWGLSTGGGIFSVKLLSKVLANDLSSNIDEGQFFCTKGVQCYAHTFKITQCWALFAGSLALVTLVIGYLKRVRSHHASFKLGDE